VRRRGDRFASSCSAPEGSRTDSISDPMSEEHQIDQGRELPEKDSSVKTKDDEAAVGVRHSIAGRSTPSWPAFCP